MKFNHEDFGFYIPRDEGGDPPKMQYVMSKDDIPAEAPFAGIIRWFEPIQQPIDEYGNMENLIVPKKRRHGSEPGSWWHRQMKRTYDFFANPHPSIKRGRKQMRRAFSKHKPPVVSAAGKPTVEITLTKYPLLKE